MIEPKNINLYLSLRLLLTDLHAYYDLTVQTSIVGFIKSAVLLATNKTERPSRKELFS